MSESVNHLTMAHLSFPVMHKVDNVDIFVQLQMEINY